MVTLASLVDEIEDRLYRRPTAVHKIAEGFKFNQFVLDAEGWSYSTRVAAMFPLASEALGPRSLVTSSIALTR